MCGSGACAPPWGPGLEGLQEIQPHTPSPGSLSRLLTFDLPAPSQRLHPEVGTKLLSSLWPQPLPQTMGQPPEAASGTNGLTDRLGRPEWPGTVKGLCLLLQVQILTAACGGWGGSVFAVGKLGTPQDPRRGTPGGRPGRCPCLQGSGLGGAECPRPDVPIPVACVWAGCHTLSGPSEDLGGAAQPPPVLSPSPPPPLPLTFLLLPSDTQKCLPCSRARGAQRRGQVLVLAVAMAPSTWTQVGPCQGFVLKSPALGSSRPVASPSCPGPRGEATPGP